MDSYQQKIVDQIDARRSAMEAECETCSGSGGKTSAEDEFTMCYDCLGQGVTLSADERKVILDVAFYSEHPDDSILNKQFFD